MSGLGIAGAGTMGAGIAQLGVLAGYETLLHDPDAAALEGALERIGEGLRKGVERGRWDEGRAEQAMTLLRPSPKLADLAPAELVIEAAPENLELKREILAELESSCGPDAVLATNTSSIPVTAIAAGVERRGRVVGMHFFNPPPLMPLVEVIPGMETEAAVVETARAAGERLGKRVIVAEDVPGFLVNRCGRPFYGESLRLLAERIAPIAQIDRICRTAGGFRMGPFELMDLVGIDVGYDVARSFYERSWGEPRWRPSPLQARMVQSGNLGRKTGRGWHDYSGGSRRGPDPEPPPAGDGGGRAIAVLGGGTSAERLRALAAERGFELRDAPGDDVEASFLAADAGPVPEGPAALLCETRSLASWEAPAAVGFALPSGAAQPYCELTRLPSSPDAVRAAVEGVLSDLGLRCEWVGDGPGLVLGRILAQIANEGAFALGEGVGEESEIDTAAELGLNYPHGPLAFGRLIGWKRVSAILAGIWAERREERYRPAPKLLELATLEGHDG